MSHFFGKKISVIGARDKARLNRSKTTMIDDSSNKRRRVDGAGPTSHIIHLSALPIGVLSHVSCFLAAPSRALFAATLFGNDKNDENRSKLAGNDWGILDFGDIEAALANKIIG